MIKFIVGVILGTVVTLFIVNSSKNNNEYDSYMQGFRDGRKSRLSHKIRKLNIEAEQTKTAIEASEKKELTLTTALNREHLLAIEKCIEILEREEE